GGMRGGVGTAGLRLGSGITVAALVVVNAVGSAVDPASGVLYGGLFEEGPAGAGAVRPARAVHEAAVRRLAEARAASVRPPLNTTLAVVATDAVLTRAQAQKVAGTAHDGIARAIRPVHLMNDGDTVFALATGARELPAGEGPLALNEVLAAGADLVTRAIVRAVLAAPAGLRGPGGDFPSYGELYGPAPEPYSR
ncbi:P1 family peptidase, partial [Streptomyces sp. NRRL F-5727]|uniref:P1 family peptidase n=1 Tax=Streptomyces sp. NRRL F-5727 TaxID=1463871 RepID=UPI0004C89F70